MYWSLDDVLDMPAYSAYSTMYIYYIYILYIYILCVSVSVCFDARARARVDCFPAKTTNVFFGVGTSKQWSDTQGTCGEL